MEPTRTDATLAISRRSFTSLVSQLTGGYPNDFDDTQPPGPWDPIIRQALERMREFGPFPDPWRTSGPFPEPWRTPASALDRLSRVALNPQPLPPRVAWATALAHQIIDRTNLLHDLIGIVAEEDRANAEQMASLYLSQFVEDCGNGRIPPWPVPWPLSGPEHNGEQEAMGMLEMVVMGVQFANAAGTVANERLRHDFARAGDRLIDAGLEHMR